MGKRAALLLLVTLAALNLITIESAFAQTMPKPSVPEFTLQLEDNWLKVTVQNQPIIPNGHDSAWIFYDIRYKWHESTNWYPSESNSNEGYYIRETGTSGTTEWQISTNGFYELLGMTNSHQLDYQIRTINGYVSTALPYVPPIGLEPDDYPVIIVNTSGWSDIQTITIPESQAPSTTPSPSPTPTITPYREPQQTEQLAIIIGVTITVVIIGAGLGFLVYLIKRK